MYIFDFLKMTSN